MIYQRTAIAPLTSCLTPGVQFRRWRWEVEVKLEVELALRHE
jgi:hypothetical protein